MKNRLTKPTNDAGDVGTGVVVDVVVIVLVVLIFLKVFAII